MKKTILLIAILAILTLKNQAQIVTDYDGNVYNTVIIGTQVWMKENLRVTHYNNGVEIPQISNSSVWISLSTGARCYYNNDSTQNALLYGALYNFFTIQNTNNICPSGWHVPSDSEFSTLVNFLGGTSVAGGKLKETGLTNWNSPNTGATNSSNFTGIGAGSRGYETGSYSSKKGFASFWTSTPSTIGSSGAKSYYLSYNYSSIGSGWSDKNIGFSVRCVKDITVSNPTFNTSQIETICQGESIAVGTHIYIQNGIYTDSLKTSEGWDSIVTTQVIVKPIYNITQTKTMCQGESITVGTHTYTQSGTFVDYLQTINGCDSIITTQVILNPSYNLIQNTTIKSNESTTVGSQIFSQNGTYLINLQTLMGCDSVITLNLTVETLSDINETTKYAEMKIYPNPTTNDFSLNISGKVIIEIYSLQGNLLEKKTISDNEKIAVSNFEKGSYIVKIITNNSIITKTLVID